MIKVVEFKRWVSHDRYLTAESCREKGIDIISMYMEKGLSKPTHTEYFDLTKLNIEITALELLNTYLKINNKSIDLIEIQKHSDSFLLIYREITDENRDLINKIH